MNINIGGVYSILNKKNRFIYIGSVGKWGFKKRWQMHRRELNKKRHHSWILQKDWIKYGSKNFSFQVIKRCSIGKAKKLEQKIIDKVGVGIKNKSYNIMDRVDRAHLPKEVIAKIKKAHRNPNLIIKTNTSGFKGVCLYRNGSWKASIQRYSHSYHLGYYKTAKKASIEYNKINKLTDKQFYKWWNKEYDTNRKNYQYRLYGEQASSAKLTKKSVNKIRKLYKTGKYIQAKLGKLFKVNPSHISNLINNKVRKRG